MTGVAEACPGTGAGLLILVLTDKPRVDTLLARTLARGLARFGAPAEAREVRLRDLTMGILKSCRKKGRKLGRNRKHCRLKLTHGQAEYK